MNESKSHSQRIHDLQAQFDDARTRLDRLLMRSTWHYDVDNRRRSFTRASSSQRSFDISRLVEISAQPGDVSIPEDIQESDDVIITVPGVEAEE